MFRVCCGMVVVLVLATFAGAGGMTAQAFLYQVMVGGLAAEESGATETIKEEITQIETEEGKKIKNEVETAESLKPELNELLGRLLSEMISPTIEQGLIAKETSLMFDMIDIEGMPQSAALDALAKAGLESKPREVYEYNDEIPAGFVIRQEPEPKTPTKADSEITVVISEKKIAIEPFQFQLDIAGPVVWGQRIVHRPFDVQRGPEGEYKIMKVPLFSIASDGEHDDPADTDYDLLEARAVSIASNLVMAWHMMDDGAQLVVMSDQSGDIEAWHVRGPFKPEYPLSSGNRQDKVSKKHCVHINAVNSSTSLRVMTVFPLDANLYGSPRYSSDEGQGDHRERLSAQETAEYIVALMEVHYLLFSKGDMSFNAFTNLDIDRVRISQIFEHVREKAERLSSNDRPVSENLRRAIADYTKKTEADLLYNFARIVPDDWRIREEHGK